MAVRIQPLQPFEFPLHGERLIEASAGTGKTYTITALYLRLLLGHSPGGDAPRAPLNVDQILVVTFTEAATQELRDRIRSRIHSAKQGFMRGQSDDPLVQQLIETWPESDAVAARLAVPVALLDRAEKLMDQAAIFTIHGFCQRMLRENAFESGSLFETELVTDEQHLRYQGVADFWRQRFYPLSKPLVRELRRWWASPEALLQSVRPYLNQCDLQLLPALEKPDLEALYQARIAELEALKAQWRAAEADLADLIQASGVSKQSYNSRYLPRWLAEMSAFAAGPVENLQLPECLEKFSQAVLIAKTAKGEPPRHPVFAAVDELLAERPGLREAVLTLALEEVRERLRETKARYQQLSFDDLLGQLAAALDTAAGERLAARIRAQYPVAMIDEFQDTDPLQYRIFQRLYAGRGEAGLFMIGDPKQAIYAFRGADIYTYLQARERVSSHFSLETNWRSSSAMIAAVNRLFAQAEAPFLETAIPYLPVQAAGKADREPFTLDGETPPALECWFYDSGAPTLNREAYLEVQARATASRISDLLTRGDQGRARIGERSLRAGDIAVLVRTGNEGRLIRDALAAQNIPSVYLSNRESVFATTEAVELYRILVACNEPTDESLVRVALATSLLGLDAQALDGLSEEEDRWEAAIEEFAGYQNDWRRLGVLPMLHRLLARRQIAERLLSEPQGERRLTDLLHLGELLQQASLELEGEHGLLRWLAEHLTAPNGEAEEQQVRLESDRRLVQIVTIHKSKGLEYNLVFLPFICAFRRASQALYHDPDTRRACLDLLAGKEALERADRERLAEDLRLLYVALTRSVHACYLGLAPLKLGRGKGTETDLHHSAIGYLLQGPQAGDKQRLLEALQALAAGQTHTWVGAPPPPAGAPYAPPVEPAPQLAARRFSGSLATDWRVTSYSALSQHSHSGLELLAERLDWEVDADAEAGNEEIGVGNSGIFAFPKGARAGTFLHELFEALEFPEARGAELRELIDQRLALAGFEAQWGSVLEQLVGDVLDAPLQASGQLRLRDIPARAKRVEMEFYLPLATLQADALNRLLRAEDPLSARAPDLTFHTVKGMLKGFIDLVFEHQGRYYVLDYKSNHLGDRIEDYAADALAEAMLAHRYDLQYQLYSLALHRYLRSRLPDYDYQVHFGGVYYLFLRGMRAGQEERFGVFQQRPTLALIDGLDRLFAGSLSTEEVC